MNKRFQSVAVFMLVAMLAQSGFAFSGCGNVDEKCNTKESIIVTICHGSMGVMDDVNSKTKVNLTNDCCHISVNDTSTPSIKPTSIGNLSLSLVSDKTEITIAPKEKLPYIIAASPVGCSSHSKQSLHCTFLI